MQMKNNKRVPLVVVILVVVVIFFGISKILARKDDNVQKLSIVYEELNSSQMYLFEMEQNNNNKTIMAKKYDKTMIDQYSKDSETKVENHTTTLVKDNNTYFILHNREEYYVYEQNNVEQNILTDGIKEVLDKSYTTGEEKVKGKKYNYEEYTGTTMFTITNTMEQEDANVKTRFYFDKDNNLVYIKTIYGDQAELLKVKLENNVDDSAFEIPSNYAEN